MPVLHVVGMTSFNTSFTAAVAFIREENEEYYKWALEQVAQLCGLIAPATIITDREFALMNVLLKVFPSSAHKLCNSHIQKNIVQKGKRIVP